MRQLRFSLGVTAEKKKDKYIIIELVYSYVSIHWSYWKVFLVLIKRHSRSM